MGNIFLWKGILINKSLIEWWYYFLNGERLGELVKTEKRKLRLKMWKKKILKSLVNTDFKSQDACFLQIPAQATLLTTDRIFVDTRIWIRE
jgi:hypothetical protein